MIIKKLILERYNRFTLNNIRYFEYTPTRSNLIIGSNGSGKSSLVSQLSPLPVNKSDFDKGYKEIHIEHRGVDYVLTFDNGKYSFLKDGIELNESHTVKTQSTLVFEHFRLNQNIFNVLINEKLFTDMSPNERKDWFTMISPMDYSYLITVFNNAKTKLRDLQGAYKIVSNRAVSIERGLLSKEEVELLEKEVDVLQDTIDKFSAFINVGIHKSNEIEIMPLMSKYRVLRDTLEKTQSIYRKEALLNQTRDKINEVLKRLEKIDVSIKSNDVDNKIKELKEHLDKLTYLDLDDVSLIESLLYDNDTFKTIIMDLQGHKDYSIEEFNLKKQEHFVLTQQLNVFNAELERLDKIRIEQEAAEKSETVECPKCSHGFKVGFDPKTLETTKDKMFTLTEKTEKLKVKIRDVEEELQEITNYFDMHKRLKDLLSNTPKLKAFLFKDKLSVTYNTLIASFEDTVKYQSILKKIDELEKEKVIVDETTKTLNEEKEEEKKDLELKLSILNKRVSRLTKEINYIKKQKEALKNVVQLQQQLMKLLEDQKKSIESRITIRNNKYYQDAIIKAKDLLRVKQSALTAYKNEEYLYKKTKKEIEDLDEDIKATKDIVDALSPNKGLIGKTLTGFLNDFVNRVNHIISKVWTYEMKVVAPDLTNGNLDYKFPVIANGKDRKDITQTSTGMAEMINLAFKLASMHYMDMDDYPIYLDEFASSFDIEHKRKAIPLLNSLMNQYSQMFIISHYENIVSLNADVIVLDEDNVNMSMFNEYNKNVKIK